MNRDTLLFILESAILAPSADNQHRVRFKLDDNVIRVTSTEAKLPPSGGYKRALALMSLGALAENLVIAASRFGIRAVPLLLPDPHQPSWLLSFHLQPDRAAIDPLWKMIPQRHTNRQVFFRGPRMTQAERSELAASAHAFPVCQLKWLDEAEMRKQALRLMRRAETERFHTRALHEELFSAIHFKSRWHQSCLEGLPPGALGVEPLLRSIFALLRHWPVMRLANLLGAHHMLGWRSCDLPCRLAPHLGLLAVKNVDDQSVFDVGRSFQRLWLTVASHGRVLQPMPASAIFALEHAGAEGVPMCLQQDLATGWRGLLDGSIPLILFRIGFASPMAANAGRRAVDAYMDKG